jgi:hypothetical protein
MSEIDTVNFGRTESGQVDYSMNGFPKPDSTFKEYTFRFDRAELPVMDPGATHELAARIAKNPRCGKPVTLNIDDLKGASSAEVVFEYWGGHLGTSEQGFVLNQGEWRSLPQPLGTPNTPLAYYRIMLGGASVPIPIGELKEGENEFFFTAGPQVIHNFNLGFYWMYSFTVRVYYADRDCAEIDLIWPATGESIGEMAILGAKCRKDFTSIKEVDFLAHYDDFSWSGNGVSRTWHGVSHWGKWKRTAGYTDHTVTDEPLTCTWNTEWVPDQTEPVSFMARVTSLDGTMKTTPVTENVTFRRKGRSVRMFGPNDVPEAFGVRVSERKSCHINIPSLAVASSARLLVSTWCAGHSDAIGMNGETLFTKFGRIHDHSFDLLPIPLRNLREGENEFFMYAETDHHMVEVNWPGPVMLVEYQS